MALEWIVKIGGTGTPFSDEEKDNNIRCFYGAMANYGWHLKAICGALGCIHEESGYNPGIYETSHGGDLNNLPYFPGGMGLAQWTDYPAYQSTYPNPLPWSAEKEGENWWNGNFQCWLLTKANDQSYTSMEYGEGARWGWQMSSSYPSKLWNDYLVDDDMSVADAVRYWFYCLEWHYHTAPERYLERRIQWGEYCYNYLLGKDPEKPGGGGEPTEPTDPELSPWYWYAVIRRHNQNRKRKR